MINIKSVYMFCAGLGSLLVGQRYFGITRWTLARMVALSRSIDFCVSSWS